MPAVSIITPTYNRVHYLKEAIESVLAQTFSDWELLVVDDGSTDATEALVRNFQKRDARIRHLRLPHTGSSKLGIRRNSAIQVARGRYLAFLDDDDLWFPRKLEVQVSYLAANPEVGLLYSPVHVVDGEGRYQKTRPLHLSTSYAELFEQCFIQMSSVLVPKDLLMAVGGFNEHFEGSEDYDLWLRLARQHPFAYVPEPLALYRRHQDSMSSNIEHRCRMHLEILGEVPIDEAGGVSQLRKRRRLAIEAYRLARIYLEKKQTLRAARFFGKAVRYLPSVGLKICDFKPHGLAVVSQWAKPYAAFLYCVTQSLLRLSFSGGRT